VAAASGVAGASGLAAASGVAAASVVAVSVASVGATSVDAEASAEFELSDDADAEPPNLPVMLEATFWSFDLIKSDPAEVNGELKDDAMFFSPETALGLLLISDLTPVTAPETFPLIVETDAEIFALVLTSDLASSGVLDVWLGFEDGLGSGVFDDLGEDGFGSGVLAFCLGGVEGLDVDGVEDLDVDGVEDLDVGGVEGLGVGLLVAGFGEEGEGFDLDSSLWEGALVCELELDECEDEEWGDKLVSSTDKKLFCKVN